jgi:hypothetical protein
MCRYRSLREHHINPFTPISVATDNAPICSPAPGHHKHKHFFNSHSGGGGVQTGSTQHVGHWMAYCTCPGWLWWWRIWWNEDWQGKWKYLEKTYPSITLSTTNPTWPDLGNHKHTGMQNCKQLLKVASGAICVQYCEALLLHCFSRLLVTPAAQGHYCFPVCWWGILIHIISHWCTGWKVGFPDRTAWRAGACRWINLVWKPRREMCFTSTVPTQWQNSCPPNIVRQW